jgi:hypothetical protein
LSRASATCLANQAISCTVAYLPRNSLEDYQQKSASL